MSEARAERRRHASDSSGRDGDCASGCAMRWRSIEGIEEPSTVTIHGQLVHNEVVQARLAARGFAIRDEARAGATRCRRRRPS